MDQQIDDENPLRDIVFALVWVGAFFALIVVAFKHQAKENEKRSFKRCWRYLDDPPPEYPIFDPNAYVIDGDTLATENI